ncbi:hypothetical protein C8Q74DRAFT_354180 [Fomes fomentarius]|nr:hypothetical protein C8Q74DRAFT_354180 [Fomes fomentarius]
MTCPPATEHSFRSPSHSFAPLHGNQQSFIVMDDFTALSLCLATDERPHTASSSSIEDTTSSFHTPSLTVPPVDQEYIHGNGSYSWCTIA